jgi:hypothetical protein
MDTGADMDMDMDKDTIFVLLQSETSRISICFGSVPVFFAELKKSINLFFSRNNDYRDDRIIFFAGNDYPLEPFFVKNEAKRLPLSTLIVVFCVEKRKQLGKSKVC